MGERFGANHASVQALAHLLACHLLAKIPELAHLLAKIPDPLYDLLSDI